MKKTINFIFNARENKVDAHQICYNSHDMSEREIVLFELDLMNNINNNLKEQDSGISEDVDSVIKMSMKVFNDSLELSSMSFEDDYCFRDLDSGNRTFILNKEDDIGNWEFGVYQNTHEVEEDENYYKALSLKEYLDFNKIEKGFYQSVVSTEMLDFDSVALNGDLGKMIMNGHIKNTADFEGVFLVNKEEFEENINYFIKDRTEEFKSMNGLNNEDNFYDFISEKEEVESGNIKYDSEYMFVRLGDDTYLRVGLIGEEFKGEFYDRDVCLLANKGSKSIRVRSSDEPEHDMLYMDAKASGLVGFLSEYKQKNSLENVLSEKVNNAKQKTKSLKNKQ